MSNRTCRLCGSAFESTIPSKVYCSARCKDRGKPSAKWQGRENAPKGSHGHGGYSRGCRCDICREAKNAAQRKFSRRRFEETGQWPRGRWIREAVRLALYERDGWTCQICGEPVNQTPWANDPRDATLDHIIPRSKGGTHDPENLRTACHLCNASRGDREEVPSGREEAVAARSA